MKKAWILAIVLMFCLCLKPSFASYYIPNSANCVLGYPLDENTGTTVHDRCDSNDGTMSVSPPSWTAGEYDYALLFDASKDITVSQNSNLNIVGDMTVMAWVKTSGTGMIYSSYSTGSATGWAFGIGITSGGKIQFFNSVGGGWITSSADINDGNWHHVAITYDTTNHVYTFYQDGEVNGTGTAQSSLASQNVAVYHMGSLNGGNPFIGDIDELKIFNRILNQNEIQTEMNTPIYTPSPYPTSLTLFLNGVENDITLDNSTQLNITAFTNITGLDVNISLNGSIVGINNYSTFLGEGLYNVTAEWIGNGTYAESNETWWANMTFTCVQNWNCSAWSECLGGVQNRTCTDLNGCGNETGKPSESWLCGEVIDATVAIRMWDDLNMTVPHFNNFITVYARSYCFPMEIAEFNCTRIYSHASYVSGKANLSFSHPAVYEFFMTDGHVSYNSTTGEPKVTGRTTYNELFDTQGINVSGSYVFDYLWNSTSEGNMPFTGNVDWDLWILIGGLITIAAVSCIVAHYTESAIATIVCVVITYIILKLLHVMVGGSLWSLI